jgi:hypothetical protein
MKADAHADGGSELQVAGDDLLALELPANPLGLDLCAFRVAAAEQDTEFLPADAACDVGLTQRRAQDATELLPEILMTADAGLAFAFKGGWREPRERCDGRPYLGVRRASVSRSPIIDPFASPRCALSELSCRVW